LASLKASCGEEAPAGAETGVDGVMGSIQEQLRTNEKLIKAIHRRPETIPLFTYKLTEDFNIKKTDNSVHASVFMSRFSPGSRRAQLQITDDMKLFGDAFDLSVRDFDSIVILHEQLKAVAPKLCKLNAPIPSLFTVLENLQLLDTFLQEIQNLLTPPTDEQQSLALQAANLAAQVQQLRTECENQSDTAITTYVVNGALRLAGKTLEPTSEGVGYAFMEHYFSSGRWHWRLKMHSKPKDTKPSSLALGVHSSPDGSVTSDNFYGVVVTDELLKAKTRKWKEYQFDSLTATTFDFTLDLSASTLDVSYRRYSLTIPLPHGKIWSPYIQTKKRAVTIVCEPDVDQD
jgi:hypothetical protein